MPKKDAFGRRRAKACRRIPNSFHNPTKNTVGETTLQLNFNLRFLRFDFLEVDAVILIAFDRVWAARSQNEHKKEAFERPRARTPGIRSAAR